MKSGDKITCEVYGEVKTWTVLYEQISGEILPFVDYFTKKKEICINSGITAIADDGSVAFIPLKNLCP